MDVKDERYNNYNNCESFDLHSVKDLICMYLYYTCMSTECTNSLIQSKNENLYAALVPLTAYFVGVFECFLTSFTFYAFGFYLK